MFADLSEGLLLAKMLICYLLLLLKLLKEMEGEWEREREREREKNVLIAQYNWESANVGL